MRSSRVSRRSFLQSAGFLLGLPVFESLLPKASGAMAVASGPGLGASGDPLRMAFVYVPNGVIVDRWTPKGAGTDFKLNETMQPISAFKQDLQIVSGLEHQNGRAGGDGGGDHARATATVLTGARPKKTAGMDIRAGVSVDQVAARQLEGRTRFSSLELSCEGVRQSGICDSGYSCAYQFNLSWRSETQPMAPESNPRMLFERLFGNDLRRSGGAAAERAKARERSLLDFLMDDAAALQAQLGKGDQRKLDEYLTGVREIEKRIQLAEKFGYPQAPNMSVPSGIPQKYSDHIKLMFDMLTLAFQTDSTRVATFLMAHDGSNRNFTDIGVTSGHHELSHHQNDAGKIAQIAKIDRFYMEQFAYFLGRLRDTKEASGRSLLDNSMIVYCSGLSDANHHSHENLPVILAGRGGGSLAASQHLSVSQPMPMTNLYMSLLDRMGVKTDRVGDSTGMLAGV
jgi:Protein of unknown function (DUF1552)